MAINNKPIFTGKPVTTVNRITNSTAALALPDQNVITIWPKAAGVSTFLQKIRLKVTGSTSSATIIKIIFYKLGSSRVYDEIFIPITTVSTNYTTPTYEIPINVALDDGVEVYAGTTVVIGSGGLIDITCVGGTYTENTA